MDQVGVTGTMPNWGTREGIFEECRMYVFPIVIVVWRVYLKVKKLFLILGPDALKTRIRSFLKPFEADKENGC